MSSKIATVGGGHDADETGRFLDNMTVADVPR